MGRGGLAAMGSGRGSGMMRQQVASKRIDFSIQGRNALASVNSDSDEEPPLTDRLVFGKSPCFLQMLLVEVYAAQYRLQVLLLVLLLRATAGAAFAHSIVFHRWLQLSGSSIES
jgi:hypothetical protein